MATNKYASHFTTVSSFSSKVVCLLGSTKASSQNVDGLFKYGKQMNDELISVIKQAQEGAG